MKIETNDLLKFVQKCTNMKAEEVLSGVKEMIIDDTLKQYTIWQTKKGMYKTYVPSAKGRKQISAKTKERLVEKLLEEQKNNRKVTFETCFHMWNEYCFTEEDLERSTIDKHESDFKRFFSNHPEFIHKDIRKITQRDCAEVIKAIRREFKGKIAAQAFGDAKSLLNKTMDYARTELYYDVVFTRELLKGIQLGRKSAKKPCGKTQIFYEDEVELIVQQIQNKYWDNPRHLGILLMMTTGLRLGELSALRRLDFIDGNKLYIHSTEVKEKRDGKTYTYVADHVKTDTSEETIVLSKEAILIVEQLRKINMKNTITSEWMFNNELGERLTKRAFDHALRKLCRELGIEERSCHKLRKTFCSYLLESGVSSQNVQKLMRHKDYSTTQKHYIFSVKKKEELKEILDEHAIISIG